MPRERNIAERLNKEWGIGARHSRYREDGKWYHLLREFPAAFIDANGYIIFKTKDEYYQCKYLTIKEVHDHVHIYDGISSIPGYTRIADRDQPQAIDLSEPPEPLRKSIEIKRIIRDSTKTKHVKEIYNNTCQLCGIFIDLGNDIRYSEAHHIKPLGEPHRGPDDERNIICVCPNCHAKLDFKAIELDKSKLRLDPRHDIDEKYLTYHNEIVFKSKRS